MVAAGRLRHRILIQARSETRNEYGERDLTWTTVATVWAHVRAVSGRERLAADTQIGISDYVVRMRSRGDVTQDNRLTLEDGTLLEVEAVIPDEKKRQIDCLCKRRTNE